MNVITISSYISDFISIPEQCSVMQLDWNTFGGYVVLDSINIASTDKDNIIDQIWSLYFP